MRAARKKNYFPQGSEVISFGCQDSKLSWSSDLTGYSFSISCAGPSSCSRPLIFGCVQAYSLDCFSSLPGIISMWSYLISYSLHVSKLITPKFISQSNARLIFPRAQLTAWMFKHSKSETKALILPQTRSSLNLIKWQLPPFISQVKIFKNHPWFPLFFHNTKPMC